MAINVILDIYKDAGLEYAASDVGIPNRFTRIALVQGIDITTVTGAPKYEAMWLAKDAVVAACNSSPLTNHPEMVLRRILLEATSDDQAIARIIYENIVFGQGIPPSTYVLTDGAIQSTRETNYIVDQNGRRFPIMLKWDDPNATKIPGIPSDYVLMDFAFPWRVLQVDALVYGRPTNGQSSIRFVNDNTWPTSTPTWPGTPSSGPTPLPRGYWRMDEYVTRLNKYQGYYTLTAKAVSRVIEDWSDMAILKNTKTGKYVKVGANSARGQAIIDALFALPYNFGIYPGYETDSGGSPTLAAGVARVAPYPVKSFTSIFGF